MRACGHYRFSCIVPLIAQRERLCTLLSHPGLVARASGLLGQDFPYLGGAGNSYTGENFR